MNKDQIVGVVVCFLLSAAVCWAQTEPSDDAAALADAARLDQLLDSPYPAQEIDQGPGVFDVDPAADEPFPGLYSQDDLRFLESQRDVVVPRLTKRLADDGSRLAAVLLAWLGDEEALPELRRWLLLADDTYGWETSAPVRFSEGNHRGYHAFSRAIEALSGERLEQAVELSADELAALEARSDDTALMLLHRLAPDVARQKIFASFREPGSELCYQDGNTIRQYELLAPGTAVESAYEALGQPARQSADAAYYCCSDPTWSGDFRIRMADGKVTAFESEYRDAGDGDPPWCPEG